MDQTVTVLMLDLPPALAERLHLARARHGGRKLQDLALEALEEWLKRRESGGGEGDLSDVASP